MAFQHGLGHAPPPTVIDHVEDQAKHSPKIDVANRGQTIEPKNAIQLSRPPIDRDAERAVVRKLDWRVPTLLGVLCWFFRLF